MKIWFNAPPPPNDPPDGPLNGLEVGCFVLADGKAEDGAAAEITSPKALLPEGAAAWVVPSGLGGYLDLLRYLAENSEGKLIFVALNGLGSKALKATHQALEGCNFVHLFDAQDQDHVSYLEQLSWLRSREVAFAIMSRSTEKLILAATAGAEHLIVPNPSEIDLDAISRVAAPAQPNALRPVSATEIDHLAGREASLGVKRAKAKGDMLTEADLCVIVSAERGLAPFLKDQICGQKLRYAIEPGEPLHFGHLKEGAGHD